MATWPVSLPQTPLYNGMTGQPERNHLVFKTDVGPGQRRRRSTARSKLYAVKFNMTDAQRIAFIAFFEDDAADGALPFSWVDPFSGDAAEFYFEAEYIVVPIASDLYEISFTVRRFP